MTYRQKLLDPRWKILRIRILKRDSYQCSYCGEKSKPLHVHHIIYNINHNPWDVDEAALQTLCEDCHKVTHYKGLTEREERLIQEVQMIAQVYSNSQIVIQDMIKTINQIILHG